MTDEIKAALKEHPAPWMWMPLAAHVLDANNEIVCYELGTAEGCLVVAAVNEYAERHKGAV